MRDPDEGNGGKPSVDGLTARPRFGVDRRRLLIGGALAGVGTAAAADIARHDGELGAPPQTFSGTMPWRGGAADYPVDAQGGTSYIFFNGVEAAFIEAAVDRMIPRDEVGPSGTEAGVHIFLDRQLAGGMGRGEHYYMGGPWPKGTPEQGYQTRFTPAQFYRAAIPAIDGYAKDQNGGKLFKDLGADGQDGLLKALESGDAKLGGGVESKAFFALFLQNVKEGYFSDPLYGGNRELSAWKMIGFPGAHYDYREWVPKHNQRVPYPAVGIKGRPAWDHA